VKLKAERLSGTNSPKDCSAVSIVQKETAGNFQSTRKNCDMHPLLHSQFKSDDMHSFGAKLTSFYANEPNYENSPIYKDAANSLTHLK